MDRLHSLIPLIFTSDLRIIIATVENSAEILYYRAVTPPIRIMLHAHSSASPLASNLRGTRQVSKDIPRAPRIGRGRFASSGNLKGVIGGNKPYWGDDNCYVMMFWVALPLAYTFSWFHVKGAAVQSYSCDSKDVTLLFAVRYY